MLRVGRVVNFRSKKLLILTIVLFCMFLYINKTPKQSSLSDSANELLIDDGGGGGGGSGGVNSVIDAAGGLDAEKSEMLVRLLKNSNHAYERQIEADLAKQLPGLGNNGQVAMLEGDSREIGEKQLATIALNEELSEHISYNRTTPDTRHPQCKTKKYDLSALGTTSVIIIFYNEPYSVLVRTVHSVLNTSPPQLLREIILVDDGSSNEELKGKLDYYLDTRLPKKVKMLRLKNRLGLIRARLAGARLAKGDVLVFLDAHCECVVTWLEPLLDRIRESPHSVLVPIIDVIEAKNFYYSTNGANHFQVGGFTWDGHFDWHNVPERERERQRLECPDKVPEVCPTYSPTMAGGLFAMRRDYFWELGSYDEQMDGWGGENLEMSFRIWQCGGTLETIPCSRIGHIFRDFHPYSFPNDRDTHGINTVRMGLVWMDEYIEFFFMNRPDLRDHPEVGDVTHRRMLREKLKCKSFDWFMNNIYPEKYVPTRNARAYGRVASLSGHNLCLDDLSQNADESYNLGMYTCYRPEITNSQFFSLTKSGVFRTERNCATIPDIDSPGKKLVVMIPCNSDDEVDDRFEWTQTKILRHKESGLCMDHLTGKAQDYVSMMLCDDSPTQMWDFEHNNNSNKV